MNRKYIDFVPKNDTTRAKRSAQVIMPSKPSNRDFEDFREIEEPVVAKSAKSAKARKVSMKPSAVMGDGMIRSAMKRTFRSRKTTARSVKATGSNGAANTEVRKVQRDEVLARAAVKANNVSSPTLKVSQARFVNTDKVVKRPLSKNVYQKKIVEPKEVPQAPVTIIQKPEKDSKVGLIVTIIITIILGAAAGTVAFLLLPK